jgi:hypothetical protein
MAGCAYCGSTILFGGMRSGSQRFCDRKCAQKAAIAEAVKRLPGDAIEQAITEIRRGNCPKCGGLGPLDVMTPAQITRNLKAMRERSTDSQPSRTLRNYAITQLGARIASAQAAGASGSIAAPAINPG